MSESLRSWMLAALLSHGQEQEAAIVAAQAARALHQATRPAWVRHDAAYVLMSLEDAPYRGGAKVQLLQLLTVEEHAPGQPLPQPGLNGKKNTRKNAQSAALAVVADKTHYGIIWLSPDAMKKFYA